MMHEPENSEYSQPLEESRTQPNQTSGADDAQAWRRVHPISPFIRSWSVLVIFVYLLMNFSVQQLGDALTSLNMSVGQTVLLLLGLVVGILAVAAGLFAISWRFYQFRITDEAVELHAGVIFRRRRYMRLDRLQAVDIVRPLFARIFGLSKLALHAADGAETTLTLEYVREAEAEQLRREILYLASGTQDDPDMYEALPEIYGSGETAGAGRTANANVQTESSAPRYPYATYLGEYVAQNPAGLVETVPSSHTTSVGAPARRRGHTRELLTIPFGRVIGAALLNGATAGVVTAVFSGVMTIGMVWFGIQEDGDDLPIPFAVIMGLIFVGIALFVAVVTAFAQVNANFNFTAKTSDAGVRMTSGMLSTSSHTVPPGRIQAIQVSQPLLFRPFRWFRIHVTVAGYGAADASTTVLPVGTFADVITMLSVLAPDPGMPHANHMLLNALKNTRSDDGFTRVPARARVWQPVAGRRHGFFSTPKLLLIRFGRLQRSVALIPHERIQQSVVYQRFSDRLSGTLSATFSTPPGPVRVTLKNQEPEATVELFFAEAQIAAQARRMAQKSQWMAVDELASFQKAARNIAGVHKN